MAVGTRYEAKLRVYEETMLDSTRIHCDCCRCIGWHHHPVTRKQYHFIIHTDFRTDLKPELKGKRICQLCTAALPEKEKVCAACGENDSETSILDYQTHLLHGMLHSNGCGHLKRINGREAGSRVLSGQQLIQIWEKICNLLRARDVSVEDVSQKYGVEFRLLNPVACGKTWYGTYGYEFGKGSFGNTAESHRKAAQRLGEFLLQSVKSDFAAMPKGAAAAGASSAGSAAASHERGVTARTGAGAGTSNGGMAAPSSKDTSEGLDDVPKIIARYEALMGQQYAPKTLRQLVSLLLRLQRIVRRNDKANRLELLRLQRREGRKAGGGGGGVVVANRVKDGFGAGHWAEPDVVEVENSSERAMRRREEEREAAAKRKGGSASSLLEPMQYATKKVAKMTKGEAGAPCANKVMSNAKPRALPSRPLRPRGADGLVPPSAPIKDEATEREDNHENSPSPLPAKKQRNADKNKDTAAAAGGGKVKVKKESRAAVASPLIPPVTTASRWSDARIETASNACVEVLREAGGKWMPRQEVRALARTKGVGDTGLLDHVLKSISEQRVVLTKRDGNQKRTNESAKNAKPPKVSKASTGSVEVNINRRCNSSSGQLEYQLEKVTGMGKMQASIVISAAAREAAKARAEADAKAKAAAAEARARAEKGGKKAGTAVATIKIAKPQASKKANLQGEQTAMEEAARNLSKVQLDNDLQVVYKDVLASYKPARPRPGRPPKSTSAGGSGVNPRCRGFDLIDAARVLLDTKQFVKTYTPVEDLLTLRPPPPVGPNGGGKGGRPPMVATAVRVLVTAVIDSRNRGPKVSGMNSKAAKKHKHGIETKPPPEVVLLPVDPLLSDLKAVASKTFQELYVVMAKYKVKTVTGYEGTADKTRLGPKKIAGAHLEVHGDGADLESEFRYQGGLDQWVVQCVCGTCDDDGERMIACDVCEVWMHTRCVGISDLQGTPRRWTCSECKAEAEEAAVVAAAPPPGRPPPTVRHPLPDKDVKKRGRP